MVLFKRKPILPADPPASLDPNAEVWVMRGTNEVFTSYDSYIERYDFLSKKHFTDGVNGKTGMNYFDALLSETTSTSDIERIFPEALRGPILRRVQFSEVGRMNDLVDLVFTEFKNDFFPGEELSVVLDNGEAMECTVREKANFPELRNADQTVQRPGFSRYFVKIKDTEESALLEDGYLKRGRNVFTKQNVRSFLKNCLQREAWIGAPWLVKEALARQYRLPMVIPAHLTQEAKAAQMRAIQMAQREHQRLEQLEAKKGKKGKGGKLSGIDLLIQADIAAQLKEEKQREPTYPCDDLEVPISATAQPRPPLRYLAPLDGSPDDETGLCITSTGSLLEIWNTLTVHWDTFKLEPFTFDDFLDAMRFSSSSLSCELLDEIHTAVFKTLIDEEGNIDPYFQGAIMQTDDTSSSEESTPDPSEPSAPVDESRRRSRLSQVQHVDDHPVTNGISFNLANQATKVMGNAKWEARIARSDFAEGGWQVILVGLLNQLSHVRQYAAQCQRILHHLAPPDLPATRETVYEQYATMNINDRILALQVLVNLSFCTTIVRNSFEVRSDEMTQIRKVKVETQRQRKEHLKEQQRLELDRRENNPDAFVDEEEEVKKEEADTPMLNNGHTTLDDSLSTNGLHSDPDNDDDEAPSRPMRRTHNARKRKRDEEAMRREAERLEKLSKQKDAADKVKKYKRILRDLEAAKKKVADCEAMIEDFDEQLRSINSARMRSLGRDRFWNRWWWFERIGMQIDGRRPAENVGRKHVEPAGEGYANGRLWVQGPIDMEREGFFDTTEEDDRSYIGRHGMSLAERKVKEEGDASVVRADQWGYYDTSEDLDALLAWLDDRGKREKDLKKELLLWREDIAAQMAIKRSILRPEEDVPEEEIEGKGSAPRTRVSTRTRTYVDNDDVEKRWRCLRWHNTRAGTKSGRHCETANPPALPPPPAPKKQAASAVIPGAIYKPGSHKKGAAAALRAERDAAANAVAHPQLSMPTPPAEDPPALNGKTSRGKAQSARPGQSGKGIATIKLNGPKKAAKEPELEPEEPVPAKGRETRGAGGRKKKVFYGEEMAEQERKDGMQTRRSTRATR